MSAHTDLGRKSSEFKPCLQSFKSNNILEGDVTFPFWIHHGFLFQTKFSPLWRRPWESVLEAIAVEASVLANFRGAASWDTLAAKGNHILACRLVRQPSDRSVFWWPRKWGAMMEPHVGQDDPTTNCAHSVSLSAGRCFLQSWNMRCLQQHFVQIPPPQIPPLWRPPSRHFVILFLEGRTDCSTQTVREYLLLWELLLSKGVQMSARAWPTDFKH